ncbi:MULTISPECIES: hypothetical protein [Stenotrophomonas]|jgi:hypothetical protein|uniref:hypothetical protein n=1 Tax=Stenotrophomonas TaxID=40323 RepID=UPI0012601D9F|nr:MULTISPECIES: hypothetical protein [Stenotrophomonas]
MKSQTTRFRTFVIPATAAEGVEYQLPYPSPSLSARFPDVQQAIPDTDRNALRSGHAPFASRTFLHELESPCSTTPE